MFRREGEGGKLRWEAQVLRLRHDSCWPGRPRIEIVVLAGQGAALRRELIANPGRGAAQ